MARFGRPGLLGTVTRAAVISGTAQATRCAMQRRLGQPVLPGPPAAPGEAVPAARVREPDLVIALQRLTDLRAIGALTDEQFEAAKTRLLEI